MEVTVDLKTIINKLQACFDRIQKLEAENAKLKECVESFVDKYFDLPVELRLKKDIKEGEGSLRARQVLKEIGE
jgi:predicted nuclease with TOPRIM domain